MRLFAFVLLVVLGACAGGIAPPEPVIRTITVDRPIPVPCVPPESVPIPLPPLGAPPATTDAALREAASRALEWRGLYERAHALVLACAAH